MSEAARSVQLVERPALSDDARAVTLPVVAAPLAPLDPLDGIPTKIAARAVAMAEIVAAFRAVKGRSCKALTLGQGFLRRFNLEQVQVSATRANSGRASNGRRCKRLGADSRSPALPAWCRAMASGAATRSSRAIP